MGVFIHNDITDRGRILLGDAQVGATFEATKIVMGSGYIPSGYTARTMTGVVAPVIELAINKARRAGDGTVTFGGMFSNETITEAFYFREFALYARVKRADGTYSDEVCYSYGNAGDNADLLPAHSAGAVVEKQMDIVTYIGNDTEVNLTVESGIFNAHSWEHAADGSDPVTPAMIRAVYAKPLGSYGAETTIAEQVQYWFDQHIRWGIFHAALCADLPPETINWDHGVEFKVLSGFRVKVEVISLDARTFVRHYDAYTKTWVNDWVDETGVPKGIPVGADLNDYREIGKYYMISGADTLLNTPTVFGSISLDVEMTGAYGVGVVQTVKDHKGNVYVRTYAAESNSDWTEWKKIAVTTQLRTNNPNADLLTEEGNYFLINGTNLPKAHGFLTVQYFDGFSFAPDPSWGRTLCIRQIFRDFNSTMICERCGLVKSAISDKWEWGEWVLVYNTGDAIRVPDKTNAGSGGKLDADNGVSIVHLKDRNNDNSARNAIIVNPYSEDVANAVLFARGADGSPSAKYRLYGEHYSPAVTATAELI